jgi:actin-related protein 10
LLVNPKERRVVISESMLKSVEMRNIIAEVLFKHFHVVSVVFVPSHLLALYSCGVETGLVVDLGYLETSVVPIYEQVPILKAVEYVNLAGKSIHDKIKEEIMTNCMVQVGNEEKPAHECIDSVKETVLEDIKIRCCFVGRQGCTLTAQPVNYPMDGNKTLYLNGDMRSHTFDLLFDENEEDISVTTCILDAILNSPIDCRKGLAENIILIGGGAMSEGFAARLMAELKLKLKSDRYNSKLFLKKICFRKPLIPANYCSWQGGALFGALEILSDRSISRERYHVNPVLPDWSSTLSVDTDAASKSLMDEKYKLFSYRKSLPMTPPPASGSPSLLTTTTPASVTERLRRELGLSTPPVTTTPK